MKQMMQNLFELQTLEFDAELQPDNEVRIARLRTKIPGPILGHYDHQGARGKKGVAPVLHQTCSGCHMRVPLAVVMTLSHGDDIRLCENCQCYLYLPEPAAERTVPAAKHSSPKNHRKELAHAR